MVKQNTIKPKKFLGQNFLQDKNIAHKIAFLASLSKNDFVVEIGPGKGILTTELLKFVSHLTAVEFDKDLIPELQNKFDSSINLIHNDFLNVDLDKLSKNKLRLVGNIPYNITTPIIFHAIDYHPFIFDMTIMIQKEVAQRIVAKPNSKDYGILSVLLQYYTTPKILFNVPASCFYPKPKVTSSVINLDFKNRKYPVSSDDTLFRKVVRGTFNKRRKTLRNSLRSMGYEMDVLQNISIDLNRRAENLLINEFLILTEELKNKL